jgi:hypothetical protein
MTSHLEQQFTDLWLSLYPTIDLQSEYRFSPPRRYRWDFCHPESKVATAEDGAQASRFRVGCGWGAADTVGVLEY